MNAGMMPINVDAIPAELRASNQWVLWRYEDREGKPTKVPFNRNGAQAKSNNPATWGSFNEVLGKFERGGFEGIGYVFSPEDDFFGIDLDACRNAETGELTTWASEIIGAVGSYTEVSPSGYGVKLVARGKLPAGSRNVKKLKDVPTFSTKAPEIAIFDQKRFWCLTGHRLPGAALCCEPRQEQLDALLAKLFPPKGSTNGRAKANGHAAGGWFDKVLADCASARMANEASAILLCAPPRSATAVAR